MPVVLAFHGGGGHAQAGALSTRPDGDLADAECLHAVCLHAVCLRIGVATVYPNGTVGPRGSNNRTWNGGGGGGWACVGFCRADIDEAGDIRAVLDDLASWLPVDADRVYAVGRSNGGAVVPARRGHRARVPRRQQRAHLGVLRAAQAIARDRERPGVGGHRGAQGLNRSRPQRFTHWRPTAGKVAQTRPLVLTEAPPRSTQEVRLTVSQTVSHSSLTGHGAQSHTRLQTCSV
jgi:hypothetical protein